MFKRKHYVTGGLLIDDITHEKQRITVEVWSYNKVGVILSLRKKHFLTKTFVRNKPIRRVK